jgi:4-hydroxybenzoate polyprenyltransferase
MANDKTTDTVLQSRKVALRSGMWVFLMLGILTLGEFLVALIAPPWGWMLLVVAVWKSFYVVKDYMHIGRTFGRGEEAH